MCVQVRRVQLAEWEEKCRVLEESLRVLAEQQQGLERSMGAPLAGPSNSDDEDDEFYDCADSTCNTTIILLFLVLSLLLAVSWCFSTGCTSVIVCVCVLQNCPGHSVWQPVVVAHLHLHTALFQLWLNPNLEGQFVLAY